MVGGDGEEIRGVWTHWGTSRETVGTGTGPTGGCGLGRRGEEGGGEERVTEGFNAGE